MASYSARDLDLVPSITFSFVEKYIQETKYSSGKKSINKGFKYVSESYIHGLSVFLLENGQPIVQGKCYHSQKKNEAPNTMKVQFSSCQSEDITLASCSCPIGLTGACGHVIGLLYQLAKYKMLQQRAIPEDIAKTSEPQTWHAPRGAKIHGKEVQDLNISGYSKSSSCSTPSEIRSTLYNPIRGPNVNWTDHIENLNAAMPDMLIIPDLKQQNVKTIACKYGQVPVGSVLSYQQKLEDHCSIYIYDGISFPDLPQKNHMQNTYCTVLNNTEQITLDSIKLKEECIHRFEKQTRLQSQSHLWHQVRKQRLTASNIGEIYKRRKDNDTLVQRLKSNTHVTTAAMRHGLASEPIAASAYAKCLDNAINIYPSGVVVNLWAPWLAATPDRKVYNPTMDPKFGLLEIKCPQVSSVLEAKYLYKDDFRQLKLKRNHSYYYQVMTQLAVTGLDWCDFFVWCPSDYHRETIYFNENVWNDVKQKIDMFYFESFLK